ncbi:TadE/TadG family type IV pilus assembly protein [Methylophaga thalassica]|uniref:TadE/TadG family type IV pilus assembly protein n=1 Tax=Methylophaga aminisulfidivorans TaxID=230105 RepID=UPI003A94A1F5
MKRLQRGVASIEFVLGFMAFWLMCSVWVEMSYMSYISSVGDLAISKAARESKKISSTASYGQFFHSVIQNDSLAKLLIDSGKFSYSVQYLKSFDELTDVDTACDAEEGGSSKCDNPEGKAIALYHITYSYQPIFNLFLDSDTVFSREMVVIQEYQRDQFSL